LRTADGGFLDCRLAIGDCVDCRSAIADFLIDHCGWIGGCGFWQRGESAILNPDSTRQSTISIVTPQSQSSILIVNLNRQSSIVNLNPQSPTKKSAIINLQSPFGTIPPNQRREYIGSVRIVSLAVWISHVEWPMNVRTAAAFPSAGGRRGVTGTCTGHGARGVRNSRGSAENGCPAAPVGLKNRVPSK
jgi:hypothetical protein